MSLFHSRAVAGRLLNDLEYCSRARAALQQASSDNLDALRRVKLLNECLAQGAAAPPALEPSKPSSATAECSLSEPSVADSDLFESSSAPDSDINDEEEGDEGCMAALQSALQQRQEARAQAAVVIQKAYRIHRAKVEAGIRRQVVQAARENKHRRILAVAYVPYRRRHPPAAGQLAQLLRTRRRRKILDSQARQAARAAKSRAVAGDAEDDGGDDAESGEPGDERPRAALQSAPATQQQAAQAAAPAPTAAAFQPPQTSELPGSPLFSRPTTCSSACQTVCEAGCQTETDFVLPHEPPSPAERVLRRGISTPAARAGRVATPHISPGQPHSQPVLELAGSDSRAASRSPPGRVPAQPAASGGVNRTRAQVPQAQGLTESGGEGRGSSRCGSGNFRTSSRDLGRSTSLQTLAETVQVALESPASMASLAARQVCKKVKEHAAHVEPGVGGPRVARMRSGLSRPATAAPMRL